MKKTTVFISLIFTISMLYPTEFSPEKAKKVNRYLTRIAQTRRKGVMLKRAYFTEDELNSYLNLIYTRRYSPEVKYIKLNLKKDNKVSGFLKVVLKGEKYSRLPAFLKKFEVDFEGKAEFENYRMRFDFENLKINGTSFSPEILDQAFSAAQTGYKVKKSMFDWFRLLPGIKNIKIDYKKLTLFY